ncbi:S-adenosyl-L-methionine-dependent methyltransferase [Auricularia subglabra TFB-10046 SS5]|nr:S-adenosyl-L-methionine-dependent methyltransferase [Auricularia subglabra TFB-10046 SS5]
MSAPNPAAGRMQNMVSEIGQDAWEATWKEGVTPWEVQTGYQPALKAFLESGKLELPKSGRAIVPGCGRGYDAILIGKTLGLDVLGADLSETAVAEARKLLERTGTKANVSYKAGDFFKYVPGDHEEHFVLAYDFTFFVAIPPELRQAWGTQMNRILTPGALLITLVWPIHPTRTGGPPHSVKPEDYAQVLGAAFEKVYEVPALGTMEGRVEGAEARLIVWRKIS